MKTHLIKELKASALSMFSKNFVGIFHGSISAKIEDGTFIINTQHAIFDHLEDKDFITLYTQKDYRWKDASIDADIHLNMYQKISEAKYITYTMAPFMTSYAIHHDSITPKDYFGNQRIGELPIYDPGDFATWYARAQNEVYQYFETHDTDMMLIRGYGLYTHSRDLTALVKKIAILENSCKILHYAKKGNSGRNFPIS